MSYILDALKKSDQQRQRGTTPTLQTSASMEAPREPRRAWFYPALGIVVAAVAFTLGSLRPWRTEQGADAAPGAPAALTVAIPSAPTAAPQAPSAAAPSTPAIASAPEPVRQPAPAAHAIQRDRASKPAKVVSVEQPRAMPAGPSAAPAPTTVSPAVADAPRATRRASTPDPAASRVDVSTDDKVVALADLPASVRSGLPPITITVHAYTRVPKDRLVGVNDKLLREGDALTPDLVLERVTPDGMIFSYKGTRFQRGVP